MPQDLSLRYKILSRLGAGSFGTVWKALSHATGELVAIKHIDLEASDEDVIEIQQEIALLGDCDPRYVTKYIESFVHGYTLWIVMEYMSGGSALDIISDTQPFSEAEAAVLLRGLLHSLAYLHAHHKIHRDVKAANVLLSAEGIVKLADFGVAAQLSSNKSRRNTFVGTPFWMAPEVILQAGYDSRADIWSLGITAIELVLGEPPLSEFHPMRAIFLIPKEPAPTLPATFSSAFRDFVQSCLNKTASGRPSASQLLQHPFIASCDPSNALLVTRVLQMDASVQQPGAVASLMHRDTVSAESSPPDRIWDFDTMRIQRELSTEPVSTKSYGISKNHRNKLGSAQIVASLAISPQKLEDCATPERSRQDGLLRRIKLLRVEGLSSDEDDNAKSGQLEAASLRTLDVLEDLAKLSEKQASILVDRLNQARPPSIEHFDKCPGAPSQLARLLYSRWVEQLTQQPF
jgi:serine/threonine protein kinase